MSNTATIVTSKIVRIEAEADKVAWLKTYLQNPHHEDAVVEEQMRRFWFNLLPEYKDLA